MSPLRLSQFDADDDHPFLYYEPSGGAEPPITQSPIENPQALNSEGFDNNPISRDEMMHLYFIDDLVMKSFVETGDRQATIHLGLLDRDVEWGVWALRTANVVGAHSSRFPLTSREFYFNLIKQKRITLSALHYNRVVQTCMQTGGGVGKFNDEEFAKEYAYQMQELYLASPTYITVDTFDSHQDINPFFILEGSSRAP